MSNWSNNSKGSSGYSNKSSASSNAKASFAQRFEQNKRKQQIRLKYNENEERRKQLMAENLRRRKQKERKAKEDEQQRRKIEQEMVRQRKRDKEQAYLKYLRNNTNRIAATQKAPGTGATQTLYDKYEAKKRQEQQQIEEPKAVSKWKTKTPVAPPPAKTSGNSNPAIIREEQEQDQQLGKKSQLQALDLDIQAVKDMEKIKKFYQDGKKQLELLQSFAEEWDHEKKDDEENNKILKSGLLDSLDLDGGSLVNSKLMSKKGAAPLFERQYKNMMASSVFIQDVSQIVANNPSSASGHPNKSSTKVSGVVSTSKAQSKKSEDKYLIVQDDIKVVISKSEQEDQQIVDQQLKDLIGYDSVSDQSEFWDNAFKKPKNKEQQKSQPMVAKVVPKQQPKTEPVSVKEPQKKSNLMDWASNNVEEAEQLFSNYASESSVSKKSMKRSDLLERFNKRLLQEKANKQKSIVSTTTQPTAPASKSQTELQSQAIPENIQVQESNSEKGGKQQSKDSKPASGPSKRNSVTPIRKTPQKIRAVAAPEKQGTSNINARNNPVSVPQPVAQIPPKPKTSSSNPPPAVPTYESKPKPPVPSSYSSRSQQKRDPALQTAPTSLQQQQQPSSTSSSSSKPQSNTILKFKSRLSQQTPNKPVTAPKPMTTCTQDDMFDIQEFIKDDMMEINRKEWELQLEIREHHISNKEKLREMANRHEINTGFQTTDQLIRREEATTQALKRNFTQEQLEMSLYRLDELLIKKQNKIKQLEAETNAQQQQQKQQPKKSVKPNLNNNKNKPNSPNVDSQGDEILNYSLSENEQETPKPTGKYTRPADANKYSSNQQNPMQGSAMAKKSLINPLGNPDDLLRQVLSLAQTIAQNKDIDLQSLKDQLSRAAVKEKPTPNRQQTHPSNHEDDMHEDSLEMLDKNKKQQQQPQPAPQAPQVPTGYQKQNTQNSNKPQGSSYAELKKRQQQQLQKKQTPQPSTQGAPVNKWKQRASLQSNSNSNNPTGSVREVSPVPVHVQTKPVETRSQQIKVNPNLRNLLFD